MTHPLYCDQDGNTFLPGYGRPLKDTTSYYPGVEPFPCALVQTGVEEGFSGRVIPGRGHIAGSSFPVTLREILMMQIMDELTDKPEWQKKVFNEAITSKWKQEILGSDEDVSEKMVDYLFDELKYKAKVFSETGLVTVFDQGVIKSDTIIPETFAFRQQCDFEPLTEVEYEQEDHEWLSDIYGLENQGAAVQDLGGVKTIEGRLVAFPNTLQHQVQPFKLADPTKPGHRKIIALFLVDPTFKIISTANVPSQRQDWWLEQIGGVGELGRLPSELVDHVAGGVEFPCGLEKAKELRLGLMEERKAFVVEHTDTLFEAPSKFSLCEH